jgi:hypothetical protein
MEELSVLMAKFNQLQSLSWWISVYTKNKVISHFSGKDGSISIRVYENKDTQKANNIYRIENIWVKPDSIVLKEMDKIITQLLLIKQEYS